MNFKENWARRLVGIGTGAAVPPPPGTEQGGAVPNLETSFWISGFLTEAKAIRGYYPPSQR